MSKFMYTANGRVISNKQRIIEGMADVVPAQKLPSDFFNLAGNLKLAGSVRATNFYKEDGTELSSVVKMGLPENVYYVDKKLGINQDKPMADLDVKGRARVLGELGVDGSMGVSGNFAGKGSATFGGKVVAEDDLAVMKNGGFGGYLNVGGNFNTQGTSTFKGLVTAEDELVVNKNAGVRGNFGVGGNFGTQGTSTFKGLVTAEDELVVNKNAGVRGNFDAQGLATFKSTVRVDNSTEQDKIMVFQNGDSKPPYLFYNKQGNMGVWNGDKAPWVLEGSGKFASDAGSFYRAGDHSALQVKNGQNEGAYFWINDNNRDADGGKSTATVRNDAGHMRLQSKGGRGLVVQADTGNVVVDEDISATRHLNAKGNANISGDIAFTGANKWIVHTPDDNRRIMYIAPGNDKGEWTWDKSTQFLNNGNVQLSGALTLGGQNIPHPDIADGAFYRADGQVQVATDDLIRLRHVGSRQTGIQFDVRPGTGDMKNPNGAGDMQNPNGQMKITRQGIMFGGPNADREVNSAQISAGLHVPNSLNIVGMSADKGAGSRRVDMWAEGGFNVNGPTNINGLINLKSGASDANGQQLTIGNTNESNLRLGRHPDYSWIQSHGSKPLRINPLGNQVCINDTCLTESALKQLVATQNTTSTRLNDYMYFPEDAIIYQNIFEALNDGVIAKSGNPGGWNDGSYKTQLWNNKNLLHIGGKNPFPNGLLVNVPDKKSVIWISVLNDRWESFEVYTSDGKSIGNYTSGFRITNRMNPDNTFNLIHPSAHTWMPIPVPGPGKYVICGGNKKNDAGNDCWISGIAFSSNPWAHAMNSAVAYHWLVNDGSPNPTWVNSNERGDHQARLDRGKTYVLNVPVVKSSKDKLLYFVLNDSQTDCKITVNDKPVGKLSRVDNNPFARFFNNVILSNQYINRFVATKVPNDFIPSSGFLKVVVDLTGLNTDINFREIGTIDMA